jgi:preprotein translocase subunit SecD
MRRWVLVAVLTLVGCAQEADDALPERSSDSSAGADDGGSGGGGEADFQFAPVEVVLSCAQEPDLVPDQAGELCFQLGPESVGAEVIESADAETDQTGRWQVALVLTESGIDRFNQLAALCSPPSEACATGQVAVVLDGEVLTAPMIQQANFVRDQIVISGEFTEDEADDIADVLDG